MGHAVFQPKSFWQNSPNTTMSLTPDSSDNWGKHYPCEAGLVGLVVVVFYFVILNRNSSYFLLFQYVGLSGTFWKQKWVKATGFRAEGVQWVRGGRGCWCPAGFTLGSLSDCPCGPTRWRWQHVTHAGTESYAVSCLVFLFSSNNSK